jgi:hypothetical protein
MGWTIPLWSCHYERSEESAFVSAGTIAIKQQIPHGLKAVRDDNSKSQSRILLMQHSIWIIHERA